MYWKCRIFDSIRLGVHHEIACFVSIWVCVCVWFLFEREFQFSFVTFLTRIIQMLNASSNWFLFYAKCFNLYSYIFFVSFFYIFREIKIYTVGIREKKSGNVQREWNEHATRDRRFYFYHIWKAVWIYLILNNRWQASPS